MKSLETQNCDVTANKCVAIQRDDMIYKRCLADGVQRCDYVIHETCKVNVCIFLFVFLENYILQPAGQYSEKSLNVMEMALHNPRKVFWKIGMKFDKNPGELFWKKYFFQHFTS